MIGFIIIRIHSRVTAIVKKPSESKFKECVDRVFSVIQRVVHLIFIRTVPQFVRHDRIKIGRVSSKTNFRDIRSCFAAKAALKVNTVEERMRLQFTGTTPTGSLVGRRTKTNNQICSFRRQVGVIRDL